MFILLAEDDLNIATVAKLTLEKLGGHVVQIATDGEMAYNMATHEEYELILLDEMMPKMSGLQAAQKLRGENKCKAPIVFLSAKSQEADIAEFHKWGVGHIGKPFDPMKLNGQIAGLLKRAA